MWSCTQWWSTRILKNGFSFQSLPRAITVGVSVYWSFRPTGRNKNEVSPEDSIKPSSKLPGFRKDRHNIFALYLRICWAHLLLQCMPNEKLFSTYCDCQQEWNNICRNKAKMRKAEKGEKWRKRECDGDNTNKKMSLNVHGAHCAHKENRPKPMQHAPHFFVRSTAIRFRASLFPSALLKKWTRLSEQTALHENYPPKP